jgi:AcrR family transcriptional regulator
MILETVTKGERTQSEIVEAAYRLFLDKGYHGTSMRQIAESVGIALGGIYNHFSGKEDIFRAVLLAHHPYFDILPALMQAEGDTMEIILRDAARRMVAIMEDRKDFLNLLFVELVEFKAKHFPEFFNNIFPEVLKFARRFAGRQNEFRPIPVPILARSFIGLFFSYVITEMLIGKHLPPEWQEGALDHFVDIYLHGVIAR